MATVDLTKDTFKDTITGNDIIIVDFWAPWGGPCKSFAPIYEKVSEKHDDIVFAKINTELLKYWYDLSSMHLITLTIQSIKVHHHA